MGELFVIGFLLSLLGLLGLLLFWNHQQQINALLKRINDLEIHQLRSEADRPNPLPEAELVRTVPEPSRSSAASDLAPVTSPSDVGVSTKSKPPPVAVRQSKRNSNWHRIEQQLLKNWTGLLGVLAVVAGVSFVAISSLLVMEPFQRFLLLELICLGMIVPSFVTKGDHRLRSLFVWLRSGAGGLQLFAAAASSSWPALGLAWNQSTVVGLILVASAVVLNLLLAKITTSPLFSASHVVIAMVPSLVAAPSNSTLLLSALISAFGMTTSAGRCGPTRLVISLSFIGMGCWLHLNPDVSLLGMVTFVVSSIELIILHFLPPDGFHSHSRWRAQCIGLTWIGMALLVGISPLPWLWPGSGLLTASIGALVLTRFCKQQRLQQLLKLNWCAAFVLATIGLGQAFASLNTNLLMFSLMSIVCSVFVWDACRRNEQQLMRLSGVGMLLLTSCLLVVVVAEYNSSTMADLPLIFLLGVGQQQLLHQGYRVKMPRWIGMAGGWLACALVMISIALLLPKDASPWAATSFLLIGLHLSGRSQSMPLLRRLNVSFSVMSWCAIAIPLLVPEELVNLTPSSLFVLGGPCLAISAGLIGYGRRLDRSLLGTSSIGLVLGSVSFVLIGLIVRSAWAWPATGLASLWWLVLGLGLIGSACVLAKRGLKGEINVLVFLSWAALASFCFSRLSSQPFDDARVVAVDSAFIALLVLIRAAGHRIGLNECRAWNDFVVCSGDLAVMATMVMAAIHFASLPTVVVLSFLAITAWRGPELPNWPRRIGHGILFYLCALIALTWLPVETEAEIGLMAIGLPVLSAVCFYRSPRLQLKSVATEHQQPPFAFRWINTLENLAYRYPQRLIAAPLSVAVVLMLIQLPTGSNWLTLIWAVEALVLYSLSLVFKDKPMGRGALVMLGLCLVRLVGWDMHRADMALRGIVFTGVGLVLITMNVVSTRFER